MKFYPHIQRTEAGCHIYISQLPAIDVLLWPPCVADADTIFCSCGFFFLLFPRLFSAVADWMSITLRHMMWPYCEFRMQDWNVLHAARCKYRTQKLRKKSSSVHHRTNLSGHIFATNARIDNWKNYLNSNINSTCLPIWWTSASQLLRWVRGFGAPHGKLQPVWRLAFVTAPTSLNGGPPNFLRCLDVSWVNIYIFGVLAQWRNFARCKIHFASKSCVLLYWQRYCTALQQRASAKRCGVVQGMELRNLRRRRHLYSAARPSRWASAHIVGSRPSDHYKCKKTVVL